MKPWSRGGSPSGAPCALSCSLLRLMAAAVLVQWLRQCSRQASIRASPSSGLHTGSGPLVQGSWYWLQRYDKGAVAVAVQQHPEGFQLSQKRGESLLRGSREYSSVC